MNLADPMKQNLRYYSDYSFKTNVVPVSQWLRKSWFLVGPVTSKG